MDNSRIMQFNIAGDCIPVILKIDKNSASNKAYLICPYCNAQRHHLYATKKTYACRVCLNLNFASQSERAPERLARKIRKQRAKLWGHDFPDVFNLLEHCKSWPKPKWKRWRTFLEEREKIARLEKRYWQHMEERFDIKII